MATVSTNAAGITGINMKKHSIVRKLIVKMIILKQKNQLKPHMMTTVTQSNMNVLKSI